MQVMAHQLVLAVDGVVDAHHIFADLGWLRDGCDVLGAIVVVWFREGARVDLEDRVLVDQVGWNHVAWEGTSRGQTVSRIDSQFPWIDLRHSSFQKKNVLLRFSL